MDNNMKDSIEELAQAVVELSQHYVIWHELTNANNRMGREFLVNDHLDFFSSTVSAHFLSFCVITHRIYDERSDVKSIVKILEEIKDNSLKKGLEKQIQDKKEFISRVRRLRHKVFAHRDLALSIDNVFTEARVTSNQMRNFVDFAQKQVGTLLEEADCDTCKVYIETCKSIEKNSRDDIVRLFRTLSDFANE